MATASSANDQNSDVTRHLHPDRPADAALLLHFVRAQEPDPVEAEHLAIAVAELIRDGDLVVEVHGDVLVPVFADGPGVAVPLSGLRA